MKKILYMLIICTACFGVRIHTSPSITYLTNEINDVYLNKSGGTMTGDIVIPVSAMSTPSSVVTKAYVDSHSTDTINTTNAIHLGFDRDNRYFDEDGTVAGNWNFEDGIIAQKDIEVYDGTEYHIAISPGDTANAIIFYDETLAYSGQRTLALYEYGSGNDDYCLGSFYDETSLSSRKPFMCGEPLIPEHAATKSYVDNHSGGGTDLTTVSNQFLLKSGGTMTGDIGMDGYSIYDIGEFNEIGFIGTIDTIDHIETIFDIIGIETIDTIGGIDSIDTIYDIGEIDYIDTISGIDFIGAINKINSNVSMENHVINNLANGVSANDAVNKSQLDTKLNLSGGTMTGEIDMDGELILNAGLDAAYLDNELNANGEKIITLADGVSAFDAVNLGQVQAMTNGCLQTSGNSKIWMTDPAARTNNCVFFDGEYFVKWTRFYTNSTAAVTNEVKTKMVQ